MGAFLLDKAKEGDLLGGELSNFPSLVEAELHNCSEYVGDIVTSDAAPQREYVPLLLHTPTSLLTRYRTVRTVAEHKHRNYAFTLSPLEEVRDIETKDRQEVIDDAGILDAIGISNETRFPNHSNHNRTRNCFAKSGFPFNSLKPNFI